MPLTLLNAMRRSTAASLVAALMATSSAAWATDANPSTLNLYSARHYQTDEKLYEDFTRATGIRINRIEAGDEALLERLRSEGRGSPADVLLLVDAARLARADEDGLFRPVRSAVLESRIPVTLRSADRGEGSSWFAVSSRARVIVVSKAQASLNLVRDYSDLARPELKGKVCTRSGAHPYMLSLISSVVEHRGEAGAIDWARGVVANFARKPRGGDIDQISSVALGECQVALTNTYYLVRLMTSSKAAEREIAGKVTMIWPDQTGAGTHMNVTGGGIARYARNPAAALRFLEYLVSDEAQVYLANGNNEWPVVKGLKTGNAALESLGAFKADPLSIERLARSQASAARIIDQAGWR